MQIGVRLMFALPHEDDKEFSNASRYIAENPKKWEWDRENPEFRAR